MNPKLPYDPIKDFTPIIVLGSVASILVVPSSSPVKSVQELIAYGKSKGAGGLSHATPGVGTPGHITAEMLSTRTGLPITEILGGRVDMYFASTLTTAPHIREGRLRALGLASRERSKVLPDVPTFAELGLPGIELDFWFGLLAPAGTPQPIVRRLYDEFARALKSPDVSGALQKMELAAPVVTPEQFAAMIASDIERVSKVIKEVGAKAD
jgi:tripartite-type tricarboxylate transporter receptor subunit TctC